MSNVIAEAALTCAACTGGHGARLVKPCGAHGCECFCNRTAPKRLHVVFASGFRYGNAETIAHVSVNGTRTLCGRRVQDAKEVTPERDLPPDCLTCRRAGAGTKGAAMTRE
jgi:hypothetical protein